MNKLIFLLTLVLFFTGCSNASDKEGELSPETFRKELAQNPDAQLLDVRTTGEYAGGHLDGAVNIDRDSPEFEESLSKLDKSRPVFVYCLSGVRSRSAAGVLRSKGFQVYEMAGGMMQWRAAGLPENQDKSPDRSGMTLAVYEAQVKDDGIVLVDFYADWCAPCKKMEPYLQRIAGEKTEQITLIRIDTDKNQDLCRALGISSIPVLKLYKNKAQTWEHTGFIEEAALREVLEQN